jgi:hypothetical protein
MLNLVSAAEQTPALALGSKSKYDFANSVGDDESVAHTSWCAEVAAGVVAIAHVVCRRAINCVDRCFKQRRAGSIAHNNGSSGQTFRLASEVAATLSAVRQETL